MPDGNLATVFDSRNDETDKKEEGRQSGSHQKGVPHQFENARAGSPSSPAQQATGPGHRCSMRKMHGLIRVQGTMDRSSARAFS
jgi:hypothetical protein